MGSYYILPGVTLTQQSIQDSRRLFYWQDGNEMCRIHNVPLQNIGVYDDEEAYNHEHATPYHWIKACPICKIASWISPENPRPIYERNFTDNELQLKGLDGKDSRRLSPSNEF